MLAKMRMRIRPIRTKRKRKLLRYLINLLLFTRKRREYVVVCHFQTFFVKFIRLWLINFKCNCKHFKNFSKIQMILISDATGFKSSGSGPAQVLSVGFRSGFCVF